MRLRDAREHAVLWMRFESVASEPIGFTKSVVQCALNSRAGRLSGNHFAFAACGNGHAGGCIRKPNNRLHNESIAIGMV
jgi:hypothetical protein